MCIVPVKQQLSDKDLKAFRSEVLIMSKVTRQKQQTSLLLRTSCRLIKFSLSNAEPNKIFHPNVVRDFIVCGVLFVRNLLMFSNSGSIYGVRCNNLNLLLLLFPMNI
jgi:hypothetical protein